MSGLRPVPPANGGDARSGDVLGTLLTRSALGETKAFEQVYDQVAGAVLGIATRVIRNRAMAEEVAQDVLVEVWQTSPRYDQPRGSAMGWIMTIAHRRAVDRVRHEQAAGEWEASDARREVRRPHDEVIERVESRLERDQVRRCLGALTELQREAVALAYYDGYTYREVSQLLKTPLGTVKSRLRDGLIRLRDCMGLGR